jgi:hypothetical protein
MAQLRTRRLDGLDTCAGDDQPDLAAVENHDDVAAARAAESEDGHIRQRLPSKWALARSAAPFSDEVVEAEFNLWYESKAKRLWKYLPLVLSLVYAGLRIAHQVMQPGDSYLAYTFTVHMALIAVAILYSIALACDCLPRGTPTIVQLNTLLIVGSTVRMAMASTRGREAEIRQHRDRQSTFSFVLPAFWFLVGLLLSMQPPAVRRSIRHMYAALGANTLLQLWCTSNRMDSFKLQLCTYWLPTLFAIALVLPVEGLMRQLWAHRRSLLAEVGQLHSQVANLETERREQLLAGITREPAGVRRRVVQMPRVEEEA